MASPPFNLDEFNPADNAFENVYPTNERSFRGNIASYINTEHDIDSGHHAFPELTTTQRDNITNWPNGAALYNTTLSAWQINLGNAATPAWATFFQTENPELGGSAIVATGIFTLTSPAIKVTLGGGSGGGGGGLLDASHPCGGGGGGAGAYVICWLVGLTVGNTLSVTIGTGGTGGAGGGTGSDGTDTILASGTQSISTRTAGKGHGGLAGVAGGTGGSSMIVAGGASGHGTGVAGDVIVDGPVGQNGVSTATTGIGGAGGQNGIGITGGTGGYSVVASQGGGGTGAPGYMIIESITSSH